MCLVLRTCLPTRDLAPTTLPFSGHIAPHPFQAPGEEQQEEGEGLGLTAPSD